MDNDIKSIVAIVVTIVVSVLALVTTLMINDSIKINCMKEMNIATPSRSVDEIRRLCRG